MIRFDLIWISQIKQETSLGCINELYNANWYDFYAYLKGEKPFGPIFCVLYCWLWDVGGESLYNRRAIRFWEKKRREYIIIAFFPLNKKAIPSSSSSYIYSCDDFFLIDTKR